MIWQIRSILRFDFKNEKIQVTKKRLYSKDRKRGRTSGITQEVVGQQKSREKQSIREKQPIVPSPVPVPWEGEGN